MSRTDKEGVLIRQSVIAEANVLQSNIQVLSAGLVLSINSPPLQFLDANGAARNVDMPNNTTKGAWYLITNTAAAAFALTVRDSTGVNTIVTVAQGKSALVFCNGSGIAASAWRTLLGA